MASTPTALQTSQKFTLPTIPELFNPNFLDVLLPVAPVEKVKKPDGPPSYSDAVKKNNPMMDALNSTANRTYTTNGAEALSSTGSATVDAFNNLAQWSYSSDIDINLKRAWAEDPELTLKLIWNLRSIHDGKSARETFYRAFGWLYDNHPRTAIANLPMLVAPVCKTKKTKKGEESSHGYWKDLSNILALATVGQLSGVEAPPTFLHCPRQPYTYAKGSSTKSGTPQERIQQSLDQDEVNRVKAHELRAEKSQENYSQLEAKLRQPKYRALYIAVARLFSQKLVEDLESSREYERLPADISKDVKWALLKRISFAGKWAPTPSLSHDRVTNLSTAISILVHHERDRISSKYPDYRFPSSLANSVEPSNVDQVAILRSFYQRHILTPLRRITCVPEPLMASRRWKEIKYGRVPSTCMKNNSDRFFTHDPEGFEKYLISVEQGKRKISGATLLPHELVVRAFECANASMENSSSKFQALLEAKKRLAEIQIRVVEAQWKSLQDKLQESGALDNCLAICDVSGSMGSFVSKVKKNNPQPIHPAVALSLLVAQIAKPPFANSFITFSATPQVVQLDSALGLGQQVDKMINSDWGMNTDFKAVFLDLLLPLAVKNQVKPEDMIKRLFVFSDMQFDSAAAPYEMSSVSHGSTDWTTNHDLIESEFKKAGYEVPQVVYWNLAGEGTVEVQADREGVAMMSGFSPSMLKTFMGEEEIQEEGWEDAKMDVENEEEKFNPVNVMKKALGKTSFAGLKVID